MYVFIIEGSAIINNQKLNRRDAIGISAIQSISIKADTDAQILIMDIPMAI